MAALGVSASGAMTLGGILPSPAAAQEPKRGGMLRVAMTVKGWRDPRTFDGVEMSNVARQCNEYLVRWNRDFSFEPWLLEGWEASDDARTLTLKVRKGVTLVERRHLQRRRRHPQPDALVRRRGAGKLDGDAHDRSHRSRHQEAGRRRHPEGRRLHGPAQPAEAGHLAGRRHGRLPRADHASQLQGSDNADEALAITTGPCELVRWETGIGAEVRRKDKPWWKGDFLLDGISWTDYGADPSPMFAAFESGEIDTNHETAADSVALAEGMGLVNSEIATGSTIVARFSVAAKPYDDARVRRAAQLAVDNADGPEARPERSRHGGREPSCRADACGICRHRPACAQRRRGQGAACRGGSGEITSTI